MKFYPVWTLNPGEEFKLASRVFIRRFTVAWGNHYWRINHHRGAYRSTIVCLLFSMILNSWDTILELYVEAHYEPANPWNSTIGEEKIFRYFQIIPRTSPQIFVTFRHIKDGYNLFIRLLYPVLLILFTAVALYGFFQHIKRAEYLRRYNRRRVVRESVLVYFLICIVVLALVGVVPREIHRIISIIYPVDFISAQAKRPSISLGYAKEIWGAFFYGHQFMKSAANVATYVSHSFTFYLYLSMNSVFRTATLEVFRGTYDFLLRRNGSLFRDREIWPRQYTLQSSLSTKRTSIQSFSRISEQTETFM